MIELVTNERKSSEDLRKDKREDRVQKKRKNDDIYEQVDKNPQTKRICEQCLNQDSLSKYVIQQYRKDKSDNKVNLSERMHKFLAEKVG